MCRRKKGSGLWRMPPGVTVGKGHAGKAWGGEAGTLNRSRDGPEKIIGTGV